LGGGDLTKGHTDPKVGEGLSRTSLKADRGGEDATYYHREKRKGKGSPKSQEVRVEK